MKIAIDLQSCQSNARHHGIGRYSMALVKEMIRQASEQHEFWIVLNAHLNPETVAEIKTSLKGLVPITQIIAYQVPVPNDSNPNNASRQSAAEYIREYFIEALQPDILYISSFFEGINDHTTTSINAFSRNTTVVVTLYDIIPFVQQDVYLGNEDIKRNYLKKINDIKHADALLAISAYSKQESEQYLEIDADKIINVSSAVTGHFTQMQAGRKSNQILQEKYSVGTQYILYVPSGFDVRKNVDGLIDAYASLPTKIQGHHKLVLVGKVHSIMRFMLEAQIKQLGLTENVILTGYVRDEELVALYQEAHLFVFPSRHEGFGLPALEAMALGIPTIGANRTSLIEVIGLKDALFDPDDNQAMSELIHKGLIDKNYRQKLKQHALQQSQKFSWKKSAVLALKTLEKVYEKSTKKSQAWQGLEQNQEIYLTLIQALQALDLQAQDKIQVANNLAYNEHVIRQALRQNISLSQPVQWRIEGPFDSSYSLALLNRETAKAMSNQALQVSLYATEGPGDYEPNAQYLEKNQVINGIYQNSKQQMQVDIQSRNLYPPRVHDMQAPINLLHHYAWEESAVPMDWVDDFNFYLQGMTCLSKHVEKIMRANGVNIPMITSGCGVDHWDAIAADNNYKIEAKAFRFLHVSSCFPRKGVDVLLKAYGEAFTQQDSVSLIIKTFTNPHNDVKQVLQNLQQDNKNYPEVIIIEQDISEAQLKALYQQCHIMVAPSRAEGFGLPMAEAVLSNIPVITTGWGGQLDFCNKQNAWLIDYDFVRAESHLPVFDSYWAEPRAEHLTKLLKIAFQSTEQQRMDKVQLAQQKLNAGFSWAQVTQRYVQFSQNLPKQAQSAQVAWVTTWNTKCGIATYAQALVKNMPVPPRCIFATKLREQPTNDEAYVFRNWQEEKDLSDILVQVKAKGIDTLIIQFNYSFYSYAELIALVEQLKRGGKRVIIELHSTNDPDLAPPKALKFLQSTFQQCDALLVHSIKDLNRLKSLQLIDNVILFPHGVHPIPQITSPITEIIQENNLLQAINDSETFVIATYGFFLPHKGLDEMIAALAILLNTYPKLHLLLLNAEYPVIESEQAINQAQQQVQQLSLQDKVTFKTDFLSDETSIAYLTQADLIVFPYQTTGEAASGAARYGITAQKPVAITPLGIFDDIKEVCFTLPGIDVASISDGLKALIQDIKNKAPSVIEKQGLQEKWAVAHHYPALSKRLYNIVNSLS